MYYSLVKKNREEGKGMEDKKYADKPNVLTWQEEKEIALKIIEENFKGMTYYNARSIAQRIEILLEQRKGMFIL